MSSLVKEANPKNILKNSLTNAFKDPLQFVVDPGNIFSEGKHAKGVAADKQEAAAMAATAQAESDAQDLAQGNAQTAATNRARAAKGKKKGSSILTSPLGASTTAASAVTKLGGY